MPKSTQNRIILNIKISDRVTNVVIYNIVVTPQPDKI